MTDEEVKEFLKDLKIRLAQAEQPPKKTDLDIEDKDEDDDLWLDEMEDMEEEDEDD